jgi:hypothetical protein
VNIDEWPVRLVTTAELAAVECTEDYVPTVEALHNPDVRLRGVVLYTERVIQLLPGESANTAEIHVEMIAKALRIR